MSSETKFLELIQIMKKLRSPGGCPWDLKQNHQSIGPYLIEEAYELLDSIETLDFESMKSELGDLLLQIVFHSQMADEAGLFSIQDVIQSINEKMIRRHPHVFAETKCDSADEVVQNWEKIKAQEKKSSPQKDQSVLSGIPKNLPALQKAYRMGQKVASQGFDWQELEDIFQKFEEEKIELLEAISRHRKEDIEEELGDLLFTLCNIGRFLKVNPEKSLRSACQKFETRFRHMEATLNFTDLDQIDESQWEELWQKAKAATK